MKKSDYIKKIMAQTELKIPEIQKLINKKKTDLKGLISDEGCFFLIFKELDLKDEDKKIKPDFNSELLNVLKIYKFAHAELCTLFNYKQCYSTYKQREIMRRIQKLAVEYCEFNSLPGRGANDELIILNKLKTLTQRYFESLSDGRIFN